MNVLIDTNVYIDALGIAGPFLRIDLVRMERVAAIRQLVLGRLRQLHPAPGGPLSSTAFDNLRVFDVSEDGDNRRRTSAEELSLATVARVLLATFTRISEDREREALRHLLRLVNRIMSIVLRHARPERFFHRVTLRQRSFFLLHGDHPPRSRPCCRTVPEGSVG